MKYTTEKINNVEIIRDGEILKFILNNVENNNEITGDMFDSMFAELKKEAEKPQARVLHISAKGEVFCTGRERAGKSPKGIRSESERLVRFKQVLRELPLITIAEVQGNAQGFGFGMAIVCDYVFVSKDSLLGFPEMKMGLAPVAIMSYLGEYTLPRHAFNLVLTGEPITPERAVEIGLISEAVDAKDLSARVQTQIELLLQLDPEALRKCKEFFHTSLKNTFEQNVRLSIDSLTLGSLNVLARKQELERKEK
jgi:methylglutaconyl-CoA hydratase